MLYLLACTTQAAPFMQSDIGLKCEILTSSIQLNDPEFPVTDKMLFEAYSVTSAKGNFIPVQIPDEIWFWHTPDSHTDSFYTSFGIVNPHSKPKGKKGQYRDIVNWNANGELINITGYQEHYSPVTNTRRWEKFEFTYLNGNRWIINGVLVTLTHKALHARISTGPTICRKTDD